MIEELCAFPNGLHDDQVDATSQALNRLRGSVCNVTLWMEDELRRRRAAEEEKETPEQIRLRLGQAQKDLARKLYGFGIFARY